MYAIYYNNVDNKPELIAGPFNSMEEASAYAKKHGYVGIDYSIDEFHRVYDY